MAKRSSSPAARCSSGQGRRNHDPRKDPAPVEGHLENRLGRLLRGELRNPLTSPSTQTSCDGPVERRVGTVGRVHPHLEIKIVDGDGQIVPRRTPGKFCTRGYSVMLGYWHDAAGAFFFNRSRVELAVRALSSCPPGNARLVSKLDSALVDAWRTLRCARGSLTSGRRFFRASSGPKSSGNCKIGLEPISPA
jgi:AMP-binding enzyme